MGGVEHRERAEEQPKIETNELSYSFADGIVTIVRSKDSDSKIDMLVSQDSLDELSALINKKLALKRKHGDPIPDEKVKQLLDYGMAEIIALLNTEILQRNNVGKNDFIDHKRKSSLQVKTASLIGKWGANFVNKRLKSAQDLKLWTEADIERVTRNAQAESEADQEAKRIAEAQAKRARKSLEHVEGLIAEAGGSNADQNEP